MIGIVVVSHSPRLAQAAVELALEMVHGEKPSIAIAAGAGEGVIGTDAVKVSEAISQVASRDGVLVMMDLGSAVLSAEMALEFVADSGVEIRLTSAPFVEGLLAAVVLAAGGASLVEVELEASGALAAKQAQLGDVVRPSVERVETAPPPAVERVETDSLTLINPQGMHARPAAMIVGALSLLDATVSITNARTGRRVEANGPTALLTLGARSGDVLDVEAVGPQAAVAIDELRALVDAGFGELDELPAKQQPARRGGPIGVSPGRAAGPVVQMPAPLDEPAKDQPLAAEERATAVERLAAAASTVQGVLVDRAARAIGPAKDILEATALMAVDPGLLDDASRLVLIDGETPERAVWATIDTLVELFTAQGGMMAERVTDLRDVRNRIVAELQGRPAPGVPDRAEPFVLVAHDLAPADTALLDPTLCRALVTAEGGPTSHTAILARSLGLPAVVAAPEALDIPEGTMLLVDGTTGTLERDPSSDVLAEVQAEARSIVEFDGHGRTSDGHSVQLLANVGDTASVDAAVASNAEGVGLFRTEFLFLDRPDAPSVAEQVAAYREVLAAFPGKKVIVRTLDAGADKPLAFVSTAHEDNPALGLRGIRSSWSRPDLLDDQLAAIALAAAAERAEVGVMAPMIATAEEAADFARSCAQHGIANAGVMIETPSAALTADDVLESVDFGSLGTNDLTQYTMAADRLVGDLAALNDPWQPAVLRVIDAACTAAAKAGKPMGVCGEAAADPLLAAVLVGLGATSLSMSARALGRVAQQLLSVSSAQCRAAALAAVAARTPAEARAAAIAALA